MKRVNVDFKKVTKNSKSFRKTGDDIVMQKYEDTKDMFFDEFESHLVTQEINAGPKSSNISNTLDGVGNLFSFIGFSSSSAPIKDLADFLKRSFSIRSKRKNDTIRYTIDFPTLEGVKAETPMPFEGGNSWVIGIERGISGFSNYLYKRFVEGRSKEALQTENRVRGGSYKKTRYLSQMINNFIRNMTK
jgi:hypothetical protein